MTVSIIPDKELKKNGLIIKIEPEKYIVGSLTNSEKIKNKDKYEFYQLSIPFDADKKLKLIGNPTQLNYY